MSITENVTAGPLDLCSTYLGPVYQGGANGEMGAWCMEIWSPPRLSLRQRIIIHCIRFLERLL